mgnify:CR=1 FL=1|tara:strand:- start:196 stop:1008 length:813 start_codon:yes stop_codon:yes gene_type:complete
MFNFNGTIVSKINDAEPELVHTLKNSFSIFETLRYQNRKILFWDYHYFRMIASLRRFRFNIPKYFTFEFLENEIFKLIEIERKITSGFLFEFQFFSDTRTTFFLINLLPTKLLKINDSKYLIDLYKENLITSGNFSNFSVTNRGLRLIAIKYAEDNGLNDVILINEHKNIVETSLGTLYLIQDNKILTPSLDSGCQDFAMRSSFNSWLKKEKTSFHLLEIMLSPFEIQKSNEFFVLSIESGIQMIKKYRKTSYKIEKSKLLFEKFIESNI